MSEKEPNVVEEMCTEAQIACIRAMVRCSKWRWLPGLKVSCIINEGGGVVFGRILDVDATGDFVLLSKIPSYGDFVPVRVTPSLTSMQPCLDDEITNVVIEYVCLGAWAPRTAGVRIDSERGLWTFYVEEEPPRWLVGYKFRLEALFCALQLAS